MKISSPAFSYNGKIPQQYTCEGQNINPPLKIEEIPQNTQSLALIMEDPDAVSGIWVHWIIYNIPPKISQILENQVPPGVEGTISFGNQGYGGPCPPNIPPHRYFFKLFALDTEITAREPINAQELREKMTGHVIDSAEIVGIYQKT